MGVVIRRLLVLYLILKFARRSRLSRLLQRLIARGKFSMVTACICSLVLAGSAFQLGLTGKLIGNPDYARQQISQRLQLPAMPSLPNLGPTQPDSPSQNQNSNGHQQNHKDPPMFHSMFNKMHQYYFSNGNFTGPRFRDESPAKSNLLQIDQNLQMQKEGQKQQEGGMMAWHDLINAAYSSSRSAYNTWVMPDDDEFASADNTLLTQDQHEQSNLNNQYSQLDSDIQTQNLLGEQYPQQQQQYQPDESLMELLSQTKKRSQSVTSLQKQLGSKGKDTEVLPKPQSMVRSNSAIQDNSNRSDQDSLQNNQLSQQLTAAQLEAMNVIRKRAHLLKRMQQTKLEKENQQKTQSIQQIKQQYQIKQEQATARMNYEAQQKTAVTNQSGHRQQAYLTDVCELMEESVEYTTDDHQNSFWARNQSSNQSYSQNNQSKLL